MPSRCYGLDEDDAASTRTLLPPYMPRNYEACRISSPAPSYHTVEPGRTVNMNTERAIVPAQARRGGHSRPRSSVGRVLLKEEEDDEVRTTILMAGIIQKKTVMAILSILSGAQVNKQWETGISPIHLAVLRDNITMIKILLMRGANVEVKEEHGLTPLDMAVMKVIRRR